MTRFASVILALSLWFGVGLSAQQPGQSSLRASLEREATRLASTLVARNQPLDDATGFEKAATPMGRSDDWNAVQRLGDGTRVVVTTSRKQGVRGRISTVSEDTLQIVDRQGGDQMLRREDVREVRLDHQRSVGQYVGLGLLLGGVTGFAIGSATECDCELRGLGTVVGAVYGTLGGALGGWMIGGAVHARPGRLIYALAEP